MHFNITVAFLTVSLFVPVSVKAGAILAPGDACRYLSDERFRGNPEYRRGPDSDRFSCASLRKPIDKGEPSNSDLRYFVKGSQNAVEQVHLLLRMNSYRVSVPVLKEYERLAHVLYEKAFNSVLPEEIATAIRSASRGEWQFDDHKVSLVRQYDKTRTYELNFIIRIQSTILE